MPPDDLVPSDPEPALAPARPAVARGITCQFCEASLTSTGEVLRLSDRAKQLRDYEDDLVDVKRELTDMQGALETAHGEIRRLTADLNERIREAQYRHSVLMEGL